MAVFSNQEFLLALKGKDGITPLFKAEDGSLYVSYDNGATWKYLVKLSEQDTIIAIDTVEKMQSILDNATSEQAGKSYMYVGETNSRFRRGTVYKLKAEVKE